MCGLIAATNRDCAPRSRKARSARTSTTGLNVVAIDIPPLRDHKEDIPDLANFFLKKYAQETGKSLGVITPQAMKMLMDFRWPGNVRELENIIQRGVTLSAGTVLDTADILLDSQTRRSAGGSDHVLPEGTTLEQWEEETIREALRRANGNKSQAARALGLSRNALRYRLSKIGVSDPPENDS